MSVHRTRCPLMGCTGCLPADESAMPDVHDYAAQAASALPLDFTGAEAAILADYLGALPLDESGTIQDEQNNAAVAVGADMARAVLAAEYFRQTGLLPGWATPIPRSPR